MRFIWPTQVFPLVMVHYCMFSLLTESRDRKEETEILKRTPVIVTQIIKGTMAEGSTNGDQALISRDGINFQIIHYTFHSVT